MVVNAQRVDESPTSASSVATAAVSEPKGALEVVATPGPGASPGPLGSYHPSGMSPATPAHYTRLDNGFWIRMPLEYSRRRKDRLVSQNRPQKPSMSDNMHSWSGSDVRKEDLFDFRLVPNRVSLQEVDTLLARLKVCLC